MSKSPLRLLPDICRARKQGPAAITRRQRSCLAEMVAYARANSPYYREHYKGLPDRAKNKTLLLVTDRETIPLN